MGVEVVAVGPGRFGSVGSAIGHSRERGREVENLSLEFVCFKRQKIYLSILQLDTRGGNYHLELLLISRVER